MESSAPLKMTGYPIYPPYPPPHTQREIKADAQLSLVLMEGRVSEGTPDAKAVNSAPDPPFFSFMKNINSPPASPPPLPPATSSSCLSLSILTNAVVSLHQKRLKPKNDPTDQMHPFPLVRKGQGAIVTVVVVVG